MDGKQSRECIFCRIAAGEAPAFKIYEDDLHLGFLDICPSARAFAVVMPKAHYPSDFAVNPVETLDGLMRAARGLAGKITAAYEDVGRCECVLEGMDIDHLHARLVPLRKPTATKPGDSGVSASAKSEYSETYPSCVTAEASGKMADPEYLAKVAVWINRVDAL